MALFRRKPKYLNLSSISAALKSYNRVYSTRNAGIVPQNVVLLNHFCASCQQWKYQSTELRKDEKITAEDDNNPIKFSTSKAASWSVDESFGKRHKKPNKIVIPVILSTVLILAWAFLRSETEVDRQLEVALTERLPEKFSEKDVQQFQPLPDWTKTLKEKEQKK
ncbi:hypothetical protein BSL78_14035 [Apostichopus japonicus]|uniref:Uncharacterized protein n=1 Tax=Stichopus japonicus TaxID=307972 RepID=A0A2G8KM54_STIJA|nr:hypothetical protein BSL78_14035 [Apostichopus japonicus]